MPQPERYAVVKKILESGGWRYSRTKGSHHTFVKPGQRCFTVPVHRGKVQPEYVRKAKELAGDVRG